MRSSVRENLTGADYTIDIDGKSYDSPDEALEAVWQRLLLSAAACPDVPDADLHRYIKDATDYQCVVHRAHGGDDALISF
jgi:hypothetical protein